MEAGGASRAAVQVPGATPGRQWFGDPQVRVRDEASDGVVREPWKGAGSARGSHPRGHRSHRSHLTPITITLGAGRGACWGSPASWFPLPRHVTLPLHSLSHLLGAHLTVSYYGVTDVHGTWLLTSGAAGSAIQCEGALGSKAAEAGKGIPGGRTACAKVQSPERTRRVGERYAVFV